MPALFARYWPQLLIGLGVVGCLVAVLWMRADLASARADRDVLAEWQATVVGAVSDATVPADKDGKRGRLAPSAVVPAVAALKRDRDDARAALAQITAETQAASARAAAADAELSRVQADNARRYEAAQVKIRQLQAVRSTGTAAGDAALIEAISETGWR